MDLHQHMLRLEQSLQDLKNVMTVYEDNAWHTFRFMIEYLMESRAPWSLPGQNACEYIAENLNDLLPLNVCYNYMATLYDAEKGDVPHAEIQRLLQHNDEPYKDKCVFYYTSRHPGQVYWEVYVFFYQKDQPSCPKSTK